MTPSERVGFLQSTPGLIFALAIIALLTFVLPVVLAARLHQSRLSRARQQVIEMANTLASAGLEGLASRLSADEIGVLSGNGDPILQSTDRAWLAARLAPLPSYLSLPTRALDADPWLRPILVNVGAWKAGGRVLVLSAGPDGIIETPFATTGSPRAAGDDIAAPLP